MLISEILYISTIVMVMFWCLCDKDICFLFLTMLGFFGISTIFLPGYVGILLCLYDIFAAMLGFCGVSMMDYFVFL